jgi:riboflavin kinase/FMN adenylyltransferase
MLVHEGYENLKLISPVVTIGVFDGVHRGHMALLENLVSCASAAGGESAVITFFPHPRIVLEKSKKELSFLTTMEEKKELLGNAKIGHLIVIPFSREFSNMGACEFVKEILIGKIGAKQLIVGYDHHFGRKGEGNYTTITRCAGLYDLKVEQVKGVYDGGNAISSSAIRDALLQGSLGDACRWLGYNYSLAGKIVEGKKIGRELGFPTANIKPSDRYKLIPGNGVYAVEVAVGAERYPGMLSIGLNPTINEANRKRSIEVHIFDFDENIYGSEIRVIFRERLRDEKKFENLELLREQMRDDRLKALQILS